MLRRFLPIALIALAFPLAAGCDEDPDPDGGLTDAGPMPDGAMPDGGPDTRVTICPGDSLPPLATGVCEATSGDANTLITGDILLPGEVLRGGQVLIGADGRITCAACDCGDQAGAAAATTVVCPDGVVSPGLINGHEHLRFVAGPPSMTAERYQHRQEWREGLGPHTEIRSGGTSSTAAVLYEELRMAMAGVTSGNTNGGRDGFVRNLDEGNTEGLGAPRINYSTFLYGETGGDPQMAVDCNYPDQPSSSDATRADSYTPHMAEGIGAGARNEFLCGREGETDVIGPTTALVHGVGLLANDVAELAAESSSLIWSPRTNISLYGDTARVTLYDNLGVLIALGTDWMRSGSMNMLRELRCADEFNETYLNGHFTDEELWLMATRNVAVVLAYQDVIGTLAPGLVADIAIYDGSDRADHRAVIRAEPEDVALVLRGGEVLFGEAAVVNTLDSGCDAIDVCGASRAACVQREFEMSLSELQGMNSSEYDLFFCDSTPTDEPTCVPARAASAPFPSPEVNGSNRYTGAITGDDMDGDGIANATDLCPNIFNPIRPLDNGAQADFDADGQGDACDPCPLDANTTSCTAANPDDRDRDMILDTVDNCPNVANMDQADSDEDGVGNVCDACPDDPNPAGAACPGSIYGVKDGTFAEGETVAIAGSVVTAVGERGFTMQVPEDHADYDGADNSGVFLFTNTAPELDDGTAIARGDTVDVQGTVNVFMEQIQLLPDSIVASSASSAIPAPVVAMPAVLTGTRAPALDSVLVRVENATVTNAAPAPTREGGSAEGEFEVDATLRVDDFFYALEPFATNGENFSSITGVMQLSQDAYKLQPRDVDDYLAGAPQIAALEPALVFTRVDIDTALTDTLPEPLTVRLTRAGGSDTIVSLTSSNATALTVMDVTVPAGAASVTVPVDGATNGTYTVTATVGTDSQTAEVRVLNTDEVPAGVTLQPDTSSVASEGMQEFTVRLDILAPTGGTMVDLSDDIGGVFSATTVTVAADAQEATFMYTAPVGPMTGTLTATINGTSIMGTAALDILPPRPGTLVINEVDYDQPADDTTEYIELYNPGTTPVALAGKQLILVNQTGSQYETIDLSTAGAELPAGGFLVIHAPGLTVDAGALTIEFGSMSDNVQNGDDDGMFVYDSTAMTVLDALGYEGATMTTIDGMMVMLASALADPGAGGLSRIPDGMDTDSESDFVATTCLTPGASNIDASMMTCM
ncbi:MAG: lamin tail domain-containing protein [Sandaracinaceae bacterium]